MIAAAQAVKTEVGVQWSPRGEVDQPLLIDEQEKLSQIIKEEEENLEELVQNFEQSEQPIADSCQVAEVIPKEEAAPVKT